MTLSEMIKKYEKDRADLIAESGSRPTGPLAVVDQVLKDLHSVETHPSVSMLCDKILKQIDKTILNNDPDGALTWAQVLSELPE